MSENTIDNIHQPDMQIDSLHFDTFSYIQTKYKDSTDIDLADALVYFNRSIAVDEHESKQLVTKHFDRFIECKSVLDTIREHMESNLHAVLSKYDPNTIKSIEVPEFDTIKRKDAIRKQFIHIFNLKQNIKNCISHEEFVAVNKKAYEQKNGCNSKYLESVWDETNDDRKTFLDTMYNEILKSDCRFDDMMQYFEFYFAIEEIVTNNETNRQEKIENTVLVNIKCLFNDIFMGSLLVAVESCKSTFFRVMSSKLSNSLKKNVIQAFFEHVRTSLKTCKYDFFVYKLVLAECDEITEIIGDHSIISLKYSYITLLSSAKSEMIENIMYNGNDDLEIVEWCDKMIKNISDCKKIKNNLLDDRFKSKLNDIVNERLGSKKNLEETEYMRTVFMHRLSKLFIVDEEELIDIRDSIEDKERDILNKITDEMQNKLSEIESKAGEDADVNEKNIPKVMMCLFEMMRKHPSTYKRIFMRIRDDIKNNVCKYFVRELCDYDDIKCTQGETMLIKEYKPMFGFLLTKEDDLRSTEESKLNETNGEEKASKSDAETKSNQDKAVKTDNK